MLRYGRAKEREEEISDVTMNSIRRERYRIGTMLECI